jgi:hypothetical protein
MLTVSEYEVYRCLKSLDSSKSTGPDDITSWVSVCKILNSSYEEQRLPSSWKMSNVVPIPKTTPIESVNKHLRPISLTPILSKVAEEFVIRIHLKPAVLEVLDENQFGVISDSSTTHSLIKMLHTWTEETDHYQKYGTRWRRTCAL